MNKRRYSLLLAILLLFAVTGGLAAQTPEEPQKKDPEVQRAEREQDSPPGERPRPRSNRPRFIDRDGDGFNDLAPDADGDGIPDGIDPDMPGARHFRRGWFRAMPDSVREDSVRFQTWWEQRDRPVTWREAWTHYRKMRLQMRDPRHRRMMMLRREGFNPRDTRLRDDPRVRGRGRHRGGGGGGGRGGGG
ncbi:hypothetical protein GF324_03060 [bacterium]|nr:hypothetical protein [bacterium]